LTKLYTDIDVAIWPMGEFTEYVAKRIDSEILVTNSETPTWYNPYALVIFSEMNSWQDVVSWSLPMYNSALSDSAEIKAVADEIRLKTSDPAEQISQALVYVQSEIRYLGIEMGVNSHQPSLATETLKRRYGDCKDKAVLLISILKELDVKASPALVNTTKRKQIAEYPPMINAFNHVIVKVEYQNKVYWLDPTRQYQKGHLSQLFQPNYHYALTIKPRTKQLEPMGGSAPNSSIVKSDTFDLSHPDVQKVTFESATLFHGLESERQRYQFAEYGLAGVQKQTIDFWSNYYNSVVVTNKLSVFDSSDSGEVLVSKKFTLPNFWYKNEQEKYFEGTFYPTSIRYQLSKPEQITRNGPYALTHPKNIQRTINILFASDNWSFEDEDFIEDNPFFYFKRNVRFDKDAKKLVLNYQYNSRSDAVLIEQFSDYLAARKRALEHTNFDIVKYFEPEKTEALISDDKSEVNEESDTKSVFLLSIIVAYIIGVIYCIANWRIEARKAPTYDQALFYPVSLVKVFFLSLVTFGFYFYYWFYRNWIYIRSNLKPSIRPSLRAFFHPFLYWSLFSYLVTDSKERFGKNRVMPNFVAVVVTIVYFLSAVMRDYAYTWYPILIVMTLLILPLASYIKKVNGDESEAYHYNSRWLLRHTILLILGFPLLLAYSVP
jgi:hypothetical protein